MPTCLCALAASSNLNAMTQLIGRILRQPSATKTGIAALDECHVITHHAGTATVVEAIKKGLEQDGLGDLVLQVHRSDRSRAGKGTRKYQTAAWPLLPPNLPSQGSCWLMAAKHAT